MQAIKFQHNPQSGNALLALLVFIVLAMSVIALTAVLMVNQTNRESALTDRVLAYNLAESGAENAILRLLRDPSYTGETISLPEGVVEVVVSGNWPLYIKSTGQTDRHVVAVSLQLDRIDGSLQVSNWREVAP